MICSRQIMMRLVLVLGLVPNASALGTFTVIVRDLANNPIPGAQVVVDLSNATDMHLCAQQVAPRIVVDCPSGTAKGTTDANGVATLTLLGGSNGSGNATTFLGGSRIYANGTLIGTPTVAAYDLDGAAGVSANDLSAWLSDFVAGPRYGRSDYDCSDLVGANDLSFWLSASVSCAATCP